MGRLLTTHRHRLAPKINVMVRLAEESLDPFSATNTALTKGAVSRTFRDRATIAVHAIFEVLEPGGMTAVLSIDRKDAK